MPIARQLAPSSEQISSAEIAKMPLLARRITALGLNAGDWSMLLIGVTVAGLLLMFI
jgi:hypothetical protein